MEDEMDTMPKTLQEAIRHFSDPGTCVDYVVSQRWPRGVKCPTCGRKDVRFIATRHIWECKEKHPRKQFSVKVGTIFEDSAIGLDKWLPPAMGVAHHKKRVSRHMATQPAR